MLSIEVGAETVNMFFTASNLSGEQKYVIASEA